MPDSSNLKLGPCNIYLEEVGSDVDLGYLGDVTIKIGSEASPLTAAQKGTSPLDKIMSGGSVQVIAAFKEITMANFARAFPGAVLTGDGGRVDFINRVGLSLRSLAKQLTVKRIVGGVESIDPADWFIFPEASPVEGEISLAFNATDQQALTVTFEAWPDDTTGRWGYLGDELAS
jgi:hypothetical protein